MRLILLYTRTPTGFVARAYDDWGRPWGTPEGDAEPATGPTLDEAVDSALEAASIDPVRHSGYTVRPVPEPVRMRDSRSDGMSGYVEMEHVVTGRCERVEWSVDSPECTSQAEAIAQARERLVAWAERVREGVA